MQFIGQTVEDFGQPLHGALHVAQQDVEALEGMLTRRLRSWSLLLERSWSGEIAGMGKFVGVEAVIRVEVEAPGPDGTLEGRARSEEHTSELQSHSDLVCRLLLEKKKKQN